MERIRLVYIIRTADACDRLSHNVNIDLVILALPTLDVPTHAQPHIVERTLAVSLVCANNVRRSDRKQTVDQQQQIHNSINTKTIESAESSMPFANFCISSLNSTQFVGRRATHAHTSLEYTQKLVSHPSSMCEQTHASVCVLTICA